MSFSHCLHNLSTLAITVTLISLLAVSHSKANENLTAWTTKMPITFSGYNPPDGGAPLTNFPALITFSHNINNSGFDYSLFLSPPYGDLRFTADDHITPLDFEVESWDTEGTSYVWVNVPELTSSTTIYALWGMNNVLPPPCTTNGTVWSDAFTAVWHMNSADLVTDSTVNKNHGIGKNGITVSGNGIIGNTLELNNAAAHYVDCGNSLLINKDDATLSIWLKTNAEADSLMGVIGKSIRASARRYSIHLSNSQIHAVFQASTSAQASANWTYGDNQWHHILVSFDRTGDATIFIDGQAKASVSIATQANTAIDNPTRFMIGVYGNSNGSGPETGSYFAGAMDEARLMNSAASPAWVWAEYMNIASNEIFNSYGAVDSSGLRITYEGNIVPNSAIATPYYGTAFGVVLTNSSSVNHTFTISNPGDEAITLTGTEPVTLSGSTSFNITAQPHTTKIAPGATTSFTISFMPQIFGPHEATVSIASNLEHLQEFFFHINGLGDSGADMIVLGADSTAIPSGSPPSTTAGTAFGNHSLHQTADLTRIFTITNQGTHNLTIPYIGLTDSAAFTLAPPYAATEIPPGHSTDFAIRFNTSAPGSFEALMTISNNTLTLHHTLSFSATADMPLLYSPGNSYVDLGTPNKLQLPASLPFTIEGWLRFNDVIGTQTFYTKSSGRTTPYTYMFGITENGKRMSAYTGNGGSPKNTWVYVDISPTLQTDRWYHLAYSYDGTNLTYYLDGISLGSKSFSFINYTAHSVKIGGYSSATDIKGNVREVRVWNRALSTNEINANMFHNHEGLDTSLLGCWPLDDGVGTTVRDTSINPTHGTMVNTVWAIGSLPPSDPLPYQLTISATPSLYGEVSPFYGTTNNLEHGDTFTCTAPESYQFLPYQENWRAFCTGYNFYTNPAAPPLHSGSSTTFNYTHNTNYPLSLLIWNWQPELKVDISSGSGGTISTNSGWYRYGDTLTVSATADSPEHYFSYWSGNVPDAYSLNPHLNFTINQPFTLEARFGTVIYLAKEGNDEADGLSWTTAKETLPAAITAVADAGRIIVSNGTYTITAPIALTNAISITGFGEAVDIKIIPNTSPNTISPITINHPQAVIDNLSIVDCYRNLTHNIFGPINLRDGVIRRSIIADNQNHSSGGGAIYGGLITDCSFINNKSIHQNTGYGGGLRVSGGVVSNCYFSGNTAIEGGGGIYMTNGRVFNSIFANNTKTSGNANRHGGGLWMTGGYVANCLFYGNNITSQTGYGSGAAVQGGVMVNCTIVDNTRNWGNDYAGLYLTGGAVTNVISYYNGTTYPAGGMENVAQTGGTIAYSCAQPLIAGDGNISDNPTFADRDTNNYRLLFGSPCIDSGADTSLSFDLDYNPRPLDGDGFGEAQYDMGCYEAETAGAVFGCTFTGSPLSATDSITSIFTADVVSADRNTAWYSWDLDGDGTPDLEGIGLHTVTNTYSSPGFYDVFLLCRNGEEEASLSRADYVQVYATVAYVATSGSRTKPYNTWDKAAAGLQEAIDAVADGGTVYVSNGLYTVNSKVNVFKPVTVTGVDGPHGIVLKSPGANRLMDVDHADAIVENLSFTGVNMGHPHSGTILLDSGLVRYCIITNNTLGTQGGGIRINGGLAHDLLLSGNRAGHQNTGYGGGAYLSGGVLSNSLVVGNSSWDAGGGIGINNASARVTQCIITNNYMTGHNLNTRGGGGVWMSAGQIDNSLIAFNRTSHQTQTQGGAVYMSGANTRLINCTIAHNRIASGAAANAGIHMVNGIVSNCIVWANSTNFPATTTENLYRAAGTIAHSCIQPLPDGIGNIADDPLFKNSAGGNFNLAHGSPCVNAGDTSIWTADSLDLFGNPRILNKHVDIGAIENPLPGGTILMIR